MTWINGRVGDAERKIHQSTSSSAKRVWSYTSNYMKAALPRQCMYPSMQSFHQGAVLVLLDPLGPASSISRRLTRILVKANEAYTPQYEAPNHGITYSLVGDRRTSDSRSMSRFPKNRYGCLDFRGFSYTSIRLVPHSSSYIFSFIKTIERVGGRTGLLRDIAANSRMSVVLSIPHRLLRRSVPVSRADASDPTCHVRDLDHTEGRGCSP
jgi:hypothetical protein